MSRKQSHTKQKVVSDRRVVADEESAAFSSATNGGRSRAGEPSQGRCRGIGKSRGKYRGRGRGSVQTSNFCGTQQNQPVSEELRPRAGKGFRGVSKAQQWTLLDFVKLKDAGATNISLELTNPNRDFRGFVKSYDLSSTMVEAIFCVLGKLASDNGAHVQPSAFNNIYMILTQAEFFERLPSVTTALATDSKTQPGERQVLTNRFLQNIARYFQVVLFAIPLTACNSISPKFFENFLALKTVIEANSVTVEAENLRLYRELDRTLQEELEARQTERPAPQPTKSLLYDPDMDLVAPPDNFRRLSVTPTIEDLTSTSKPFLRPLRVQGEYPNVAEYLDHQFRLLREDFFYSLRNGIQDYIEYTHSNPQGHQFGKKKVRFDNVRFYFDVKVERFQVERGSHVIAFSVDGLRNVQWDCSKRLLFGSLLVLTSDNFHSILLATVMNREPEELARGRLEVKFEDAELHEEKLKKVFIMAESNVYFESYRSTLETLQNISDTDLALQDYFLGRVKQPRLPKYLQERKEPCPTCNREPNVFLEPLRDYQCDTCTRRTNALYSLRCLAPKRKTENQTTDVQRCVDLRELKLVSILDPAQRPPPEALGMDSSQAAALYAALTQEVAIIQGPPGTGKTYLGLKITQVLLKNSKLWQSGGLSPIVVVCYTNHALDQFLEGMMSFTENIVRIGGQSRNEALAQFSLYNRRQDQPNRSSGLSPWIHQFKESAGKVLGRIMYLEKGIASTFKGIANRQMFQEWGVFDAKAVRFFQTTTLSNWLFVYQEQKLGRALSVLRQSTMQKGNAAEASVVSSAAAAFKPTVPPKENNDEEEWEKEEINDILEQRLAFDQDVQHIEDAQQLLAKCKFISFLEYSLKDMDDEMGELRNLRKKEFAGKESVMAYLHRLQLRRNLLAEGLQSIPPLSEVRAQQLQATASLWQITIPERWRLYGYWLAKLIARVQKELEILTIEYHCIRRKIKDTEMARNAEVCQQAAIVGLTTTGAAKYRQLLLQLKPKIVIVEEAAEVLEAHLVTSLTSHCEHLILIGDHQQLRPPTSVYHLAKKFCLDVSLFERWIEMGIPNSTLTLQHRMRPEVARLIVPHIYPVLENNSSVLNYPKVLGVDKNVFFLTHTEHEDADVEGKSHLNRHEAELALFLAKHLLLQEYKPEQITILTTYSGQLMHMRKQHVALRDVRITAVDNFQGEESDIIILSLVRSNEEQNIGFLRIENRICVALSRAKQGFFLLGNMSVLEGKSKLWQNIRRTLENNEEIGDALPLRCVVHPEMVLEIKTAKDFVPIAEGGCTRKCETHLLCGHICPRTCHVLDRFTS